MATERTLISLAEVAPEQTRWLWPNRIALGAITLLEGDPGQGKSTVTYDLAARVTAGTPMPCCSTAAEPAGVLLLQSEDSPRETVRPNLQAAGGNPTLVRVNGQLLVIPDDIPAIEKVAAEISARLVVIDPLEAFFAGGITKSDSVRPTLQALVAVAERGSLAVLLVRHLTKSPSRNVLYRGAGSVAITAVARSVLRVGNDPACDDPNRHLLIQTKSNLSRAATTLAFRTTKLGGGVRIEWLGEVAGRAGDLVDAGPTDQSTLGDAIWILYCLLRERPLPAREVYRLAGDAGVARRTLERAKKALGVRTHREEDGQRWRWVWELPDDEALLRPARERERAEIRRELTRAIPGDPWTPPERDLDLWLEVLSERGLVAAQLIDREYLLRAEDTVRLPLVEQLARDCAEGDVAAEAALRDLLLELGSSADRAARLITTLRTTASPDAFVGP